jgi:hypothetical protein
MASYSFSGEEVKKPGEGYVCDKYDQYHAQKSFFIPFSTF